MQFNGKIFHDLYHKITLWVFALGVMLYLLTFNSLDDSGTYNQVDLTQPSKLVIQQLENVGERKTFPLLLLEGKIPDTKQSYQCRISRGEFEKLAIGDTITVYQTHKPTKIITAYAINNLKPFIALKGNKLSIYLLGEVILFLGMLLAFVLSSRSIYKTFMRRFGDG